MIDEPNLRGNDRWLWIPCESISGFHFINVAFWRLWVCRWIDQVADAPHETHSTRKGDGVFFMKAVRGPLQTTPRSPHQSRG